MITIPPVFKTPKLLRFIDQEITETENRYLDTDITFREMAVKIMLDEADQEIKDEIFMIMQEDESVMLHHLKKYMETGQREYALDLAESLNDCVYKYFDPYLRAIYTQAFNDYFDIRRDEQLEKYGKKTTINHINGELVII